MASRIFLLVGLWLSSLFTLSGLAQDAKRDPKPPKLAHFRLAGDLDESPRMSDPLFGSAGENLKTRIERIQKAARDPEVQGLVIHFDGIEAGWAKIEELRRALADARKAGKKVYAYLEGGGSRDYLAASEADLVAMPTSGTLMLVGMRAEITFFKELFERLGIRADFLQMGIFKFAAEPFTRSAMSKEAKSQYKLVLDDFFDNVYVGSIVRSRGSRSKGLTAAKVNEIIDQGPFTARVAQKLGLVDHLVYAADFNALIKKDLGVSELQLVKDYGKEKKEDLDLSNPFAILKLLAPPKTTAGAGKKDKIALIYAVGAIVDGKSGGSILGGKSVGSTTMIEAIRQAEKDPKVKAIVLRVDSPGGSALASDLICNELRNCKKPVIASMSDIAASGGYYISMGARKVYAQPGTLTGSIGVVSGKISLKGLLDKVGVTTDTISRGANSGMLSSFEGFTASERKAMEAIMKDIYDQFLDTVIVGRKNAGKNFTRDELLKLAEGRIWSGRQACEHGLVDGLGSLDDAIAEAKVMGGLARDADVDYLVLPKAASFLDSLMENGLGGIQGVDLMSRDPELATYLRLLEPMLQLRREPVWLMAPVNVQFR